MTDLSARDKHIMQTGHCPRCDWRGFVLGPRGGEAINIECANPECRARYNVVTFAGQVVRAEVIPSEDQGGGEWPSKPEQPGRGHKGTFS